MEHQPSCWLETSENKSKTKLHENVLPFHPFQKIVKPQTAAVTTQPDVQHLDAKPQEVLFGYEATRQPITDAGYDRSPTTGTQAYHCVVAVEQYALMEEKLREREAAHQHELKEMEQGYKVSGFDVVKYRCNCEVRLVGASVFVYYHPH